MHGRGLVNIVSKHKIETITATLTVIIGLLAGPIIGYYIIESIFKRFFNLGGPRGTREKKLQNLDSRNQMQDELIKSIPA
jgi:hypothetical protein